MRRRLSFLVQLCAASVSAGCSVIVGADFDVHLRPSDIPDVRPVDIPADVSSGSDGPGRDSDAPTQDNTSDEASPDAAVDAALPDASPPDASLPDASLPDVDDEKHSDASDGGSDVLDGASEPREEGGIGPTIVTGGFVSLGVPIHPRSTMTLRGQIISNAIVRGASANGITIEGRFQ
jgi:hypothetical protein